MQSNKIIFILLVLIVFSINSFFILQVKKSVSNLEEENEYILHQSSKQNFTFRRDPSSTTDKNVITISPKQLIVSKSSNKYFKRPLDPFLPEYVREETNINRHDFKYIINPAEKICGINQGENILLIAFMPISVGNFAGRFLIRQTWANPSLITNASMKLVFMLGNTANSTIIKEVKFESDMYGDIVQEDFVDAYKNLTLKTGNFFLL
jgi:hypothetical protein